MNHTMHLQKRQYITFPLQNPKALCEPFQLSMESSDMGGAGAASSAGNARWNPTKEQIGILEGLYKQGIRTPTAEQIQQITARLRAYGRIEGKNVFYWFQNHKARQRQRERQESFSFLNRCFHRPIVPSPLHQFSPCPSVVCRPYYVPPNDPFGVYPSAAHTQVLLPCGFKRRLRSDLIDDSRESKNLREHRQHYNSSEVDEQCMIDRKTTLELFPLQSMGSAQEESVVCAYPCSSFDEDREITTSTDHQPFFDFFTNKSYHD